VTVDQYTYVPAPAQVTTRKVRWRYIVQRILTGEILEWSLPIKRDALTWDLSGPGALRGTISNWPNPLGADGELLLQEWGTAIYAEADGQIRWGGIVVRSEFAGASWSVEAAGFTAYPQGIPYTGPYYAKTNYDPTLIFRAIWTHLQTQPDGNLGMQFSLPGDCPVRLGLAGVPARTEVFLDGKWQDKAKVDAARVLPSASSTLATAVTATASTVTVKALSNFGKPPLPFIITIGSEQLQVTARSGLKLTVVRGYSTTNGAAHSAGTAVRFAGTQTREIEAIPAEPYVLAWWESTDCGQELDRLAQETPFDYTEEHWWQSDGSIGHRVRVDYPRLGSRRATLAFEQDANITQVVPVTRDGDRFANTVYAIGKGEGAATLRSEVAVRDGRLRRATVYADKTVGTTARLSALARRELNIRTPLPEISSITVKDHPNARIGSWSVGDDILVKADLPWLGRTEIWCRILSWSLEGSEGDDTATLNLARSDSFIYGAVTDNTIVTPPVITDGTATPYGAGPYGSGPYGGTV
jgi:hypothetical protein